MESQPEYVRKVLDAYRNTPGTTGSSAVRDRLPAAQFRQRGGPLMAVENALVLAAVRRLVRPADAPPLGTIRSLAYLLPAGDRGVLHLQVGPEYFQHVRSNGSPQHG